jgi:hypothetical protein
MNWENLVYRPEPFAFAGTMLICISLATELGWFEPNPGLVPAPVGLVAGAVAMSIGVYLLVRQQAKLHHDMYERP